MQFSYNLFLVLHFIGISGLLGGLLAQIPNKQKQSQNIVLHSARLALIAGIGMVGLNQVMQSNDPTVEALNHIKIAVKSLIITLVYVIGYHSKKKVQLSNKMWGAMVGLTITNIFIAVLWG